MDAIGESWAAHTHTQQAELQLLQCQQGEFQREIPSPNPARGTSRLWSALTERDFLVLEEMEYAEN